MPQPKLVRAFLLLWWTLGILLLQGSIATVWSAVRSTAMHTDLHAIMVGSVEAMAALLFLVPPTMRLGGFMLLGTFGVALLIHATRGQFAGSLLIFAASVFFVIVHGPIPWGSAWRRRSQVA